MSDIKLNGITIPSVNTSELAKSAELKPLNAVTAPTDKQNESVNTDEKAEDTQETAKAPQTTTQTKHILTYVAGGNWIDSDNKKWAKQPVQGTDIKNVREYTDDEYKARDDLKFMVGYGSMTITTVSL